jgi:hypothetical protein
MLERDWQGEWSLSEDKTGIILRDRQGQDVGIVPVAQGVPPAPDVVAMTLGPGPGRWDAEGSQTLCFSMDGTRRLWVGPLPVPQAVEPQAPSAEVDGMTEESCGCVNDDAQEGCGGDLHI